MRKKVFIPLLYFALSSLFITAQRNLNNSLNGNGLKFTPNKGQVADLNGKTCPDVLYKGDGAGTDIYLRKTGISYVYTNMNVVMHDAHEKAEELIKKGIIPQSEEYKKQEELVQNEKIKVHRVDMDFEGCNKNMTLINEDELDGYQNFYYAHCPNGITNVVQYNKVTYNNIYNNIDIAFYGSKGQGLKYDLIVQPHADPNQIKLRWAGTESIRLNREGNLVMQTSVNEFQESIPKVYQIINGEIIDIKARYVLKETTVNFELGTWNHEIPLIIDPWATYYGGKTEDYSTGIATDNAGNVVNTGYTENNFFPVSAGAFQVNSGGGTADAFVVKFNSMGTRLWATYYGGSADDRSWSIATDISGNLVMGGYTFSVNFPTLSGSQMSFGGNYDAFVVKFDPSGLRLWASYCGGNGGEGAYGIATDKLSNIIITGSTYSLNFFVSGGTQMAHAGGSDDSFVVKYNPGGTIIWSTFYGGNGNEQAWGIATDAANNIAITGNTTSSNFSCTVGAYQTTLSGGRDAFIVKFNSVGAVLFSTYYGGTADDKANSLAIDTGNNIVIAGVTQSANFPVTAGAFQTTHGGTAGGGQDAFVLKLSSGGARQWATFYGGALFEFDRTFITTDGKNDIYLLLEVEDQILPDIIDACSYQPLFNGGTIIGFPATAEDLHVVKFNPAGNKICETYIGGTGHDDLDYGGGITVYGNILYITGQTDGGFPVTAGAFQTICGGGNSWGMDVFVAALCTNICEAKALNINYSASSTNICTNTLVAFTPTINNSCDTSGYKFQWTFTGGTPASSTINNPAIIYSAPGTYPVKLVITTLCKKDSVIKLSYITANSCSCVMSANAIVATNTSCSGANNGSANITISSGSGGPYTYSWSNGISGTTTSTTIPITGLSANTYTVTVTEGSCTSISTVSFLPQNTLNINSITPSNISCNGGTNGSAIVNISSSLSGPYTYNWSNAASSITGSLNNSVSGLSSGTYTVTVTQGTCTTTSTVAITQPLSIAIVFSKQYCTPNTGTATASPINAISPYSFLWSNGQTTATTTGLSLGTIYTITVTDALGCTAAGTTTPTNIPIVVTTSSTNNGCNLIGSASVTVTSAVSPFTYMWNTGQTAASLTNLPSGGYTVTVTDGNGCTITRTYTISGTNPVSASFTFSPLCLGIPVNFTNTGTVPGAGITYSWLISTITPVNVSGTTANLSYSFLSTGTYSVTQTVSNGACSNTMTKTITVTNCNGPTITATGNSVCLGSCAIVSSSGTGGTGPYTYSWSNGATTQNINSCPASAITYTVTIKDVGGNTATSTAIVTVNPAVTVTTSITNISCNGGTNGIALISPANGTSPYSFNWSNGQTTQTATGLSAGNYNVTVTDVKGCTAYTNAVIISPAAVSGQFTKGTANCAQCGCKEWLMVNVTGGTSPYTYQWQDGYANRYKNQLCPGSYSINIKDKNGCSINVNLTAP